jgi:hypothetical protein
MGVTSVSGHGSPGTASLDDGAAEEQAEEDAAARACCATCGGIIAEILLSLGSLCCHDCRAGG